MFCVYNLGLVVAFYNWSFFSIKLNCKIVYPDTDSADQIPKKSV